MGVEEEFLLLADDGSVQPVAPRVVRLAAQPEQIKPEYMAYQLETATSVCTNLDQLRRDLVRLRLIAADAAEQAGARLAAVGTAPLNAGPLHAISNDRRYRAMAGRFPDATHAGATCACHVHIGIADRDLAVAVLARLRPWLPALLALTVNSPITDASDTGWSSYRYHTQLHWPTFRPPGAWANADRYDNVVRTLVQSGAAMDQAGVYFLARLSARYPTIEVRVADTCLNVEDTVLYAGVVRALVASLIDDVRRNVKTVAVPGNLVDAQLLTAAHGQIRIRHARPADPAQAATTGAVSRMLTKIAPYLAATDADEEVYTGLDRLRREGTGAERQRRMWSWSDRPRDFVHSVTEATVPVAAVH